MLRARMGGGQAGEPQQDDELDVTLRRSEDLVHPVELRAGIRCPSACTP